MAHFAQLNDNNQVIQVIVINNSVLLDINGQESEALGITFCEQLFPNTVWKQTSYNSTIRKNYASIGYTYDSVRDAFIPPKPYNSWTLNENTCIWDPPVAYPSDGKEYKWEEDTLSWVEIN